MHMLINISGMGLGESNIFLCPATSSFMFLLMICLHWITYIKLPFIYSISVSFKP